MNKQRPTETASAKALREANVIRIMLADIHRTIGLLDSDIAAEQERSRVSDIFDPLYSMLARTLVERRGNLLVTIDALQQRLDASASAVPVAVAQAA